MKYRSTCYSEDGTIKYVFDVKAKGWHQQIANRFGNLREVSIESAFIHLPERADGKPEYILCLSSQAGCVYRCLMCRNMFESFYGCLSPDEINEQIQLVLAQDNNLEKITSKGAVEYAFMAVGEPLYGANVIQAIRKHEKVVDDTRFALSTIGASGTIKRLTNANLPYPARLELSLHFSNDRVRNEWILPDEMFFGKKPRLSIEKMLEEAEEYAQKHPGKITLNYVLIDGINNMDQNISELWGLLRDKTDIFYVKVMWPNITSSFVFSWKKEHIPKTYSPEEFRDRLSEAGIPATLFESKGTDIAAGCGMMSSRFGEKKGVITPEEMHIPQADPAKLGF
jgi:23S rRNA (adenine2503-C2)-methyltransferase